MVTHVFTLCDRPRLRRRRSLHQADQAKQLSSRQAEAHINSAKAQNLRHRWPTLQQLHGKTPVTSKAQTGAAEAAHTAQPRHKQSQG